MVGSQRGGHSAAIHFSFISSCKLNRVEPFGYLVDVLQRLPPGPNWANYCPIAGSPGPLPARPQT